MVSNLDMALAKITKKKFKQALILSSKKIAALIFV